MQLFFLTIFVGHADIIKEDVIRKVKWLKTPLSFIFGLLKKQLIALNTKMF
jgi:hypothetical protein